MDNSRLLDPHKSFDVVGLRLLTTRFSGQRKKTEIVGIVSQSVAGIPAMRREVVVKLSDLKKLSGNGNDIALKELAGLFIRAHTGRTKVTAMPSDPLPRAQIYAEVHEPG